MVVAVQIGDRDGVAACGRQHIGTEAGETVGQDLVGVKLAHEVFIDTDDAAGVEVHDAPLADALAQQLRIIGGENLIVTLVQHPALGAGVGDQMIVGIGGEVAVQHIADLGDSPHMSVGYHVGDAHARRACMLAADFLEFILQSGRADAAFGKRFGGEADDTFMFNHKGVAPLGNHRISK